jgi:hypothetical protein
MVLKCELATFQKFPPEFYVETLVQTSLWNHKHDICQLIHIPSILVA